MKFVTIFFLLCSRKLTPASRVMCSFHSVNTNGSKLKWRIHWFCGLTHSHFSQKRKLGILVEMSWWYLSFISLSSTMSTSFFYTCLCIKLCHNCMDRVLGLFLVLYNNWEHHLDFYAVQCQLDYGFSWSMWTRPQAHYRSCCVSAY
jgi:hypothetical protein